MVIIIKNERDYSRQLQYFRTNRFVTLEPHDTVVLSNVTQNGLRYYTELANKGFSVRVQGKEPIPTKKPPIEKVRPIETPVVDVKKEPEQPEPIAEVKEEVPAYDFDKYTDDELKTILKNLGIVTRYKLREKLINQIKDNLPKDKRLEDYL